VVSGDPSHLAKKTTIFFPCVFIGETHVLGKTSIGLRENLLIFIWSGDNIHTSEANETTDATQTRDDKDENQNRQQGKNLELQRCGRKLDQRKQHNRMRSTQRVEVANMGRAIQRLLRVHNTQGSNGSLLSATDAASLSKNGRLAGARGAE
jgi:hypothetical protein